jgi:putative hydrolase of the HAD superfamily
VARCGAPSAAMRLMASCTGEYPGVRDPPTIHAPTNATGPAASPSAVRRDPPRGSGPGPLRTGGPYPPGGAPTVGGVGERRFDVVFLDAGGVLVSPHPEQIAERFAAAGFAIDRELLTEAHYRGVHAIDLARAEPEVFGDYHRAYAGHLGIDEARLADAADLLDDLWGRSGLWAHALPGAAEGLAAIAATGVPIVIVSNADGTVADVLASIDLLQVGDGPGVAVAGIIDSGAVGVAKPDPRIFEIALELAATTADRALHVGDAYQYDVLGARAAGVHPVLVDPYGLRADVDCDRVTALADVAAYLT